MRFSLLPKLIFRRLTDVSPAFLTQRGVKVLMLDFDNTILAYTAKEPDEVLLGWLEEMQNSPVTLCVVSNSKKQKAPTFCRTYGLGCVSRSKKPFQRGIRECLSRYGVKPSEAALVGDQIFTDVLGANLAGATSILIKPIHLHNFWLRLRHWVEQPFIFLARKRRVNHEKS